MIKAYTWGWTRPVQPPPWGEGKMGREMIPGEKPPPPPSPYQLPPWGGRERSIPPPGGYYPPVYYTQPPPPRQYDPWEMYP